MRTLRTCSFLALLTMVTACGGGGGGTCVPVGGICTVSTACCSKICDTANKTCVNTAPADMTMSTTQDLTMTTQPDLTMTMTKKKFGESCAQNSDCQTALCVGVTGVSGRFCSAACTKSTDCTALSNNPPYWCVQGGGGVNFCIRSCETRANCTDIGGEWSCRQLKSIENVVDGMCGVYQNQPAGFPCLDNNQCAKMMCNTIWCADPCANDAACGADAKCFLNNNQAYTCFPTCTVDNDCLIFGLGSQLTCKTATSRDGAMYKICSG